jgi:hypothetical protein
MLLMWQTCIVQHTTTPTAALAYNGRPKLISTTCKNRFAAHVVMIPIAPVQGSIPWHHTSHH